MIQQNENLKIENRGVIDVMVIRQIIKKYRKEQRELVEGMEGFKSMGISYKVVQMEGWVKGIDQVCCDLEDVVGI